MTNDSIFEHGGNLQAAVAKAVAEKKALLCFVSDDNETSSEWEAVLLDRNVEEKLKSTTVVLKLMAGSEQASFLNAVCPVQHSPAVIIIFNAQVVANYQEGQVSFETFAEEIRAKYGSPTGSIVSPSIDVSPKLPGYIDLPQPDGRMRLPNNAYDRFRELTDAYLRSGVSGKGLLQIQLRLLEATKIEVITSAVNDIRTSSEPVLSEAATSRLLNMPASSLVANTTVPAPSPAMTTPSTPMVPGSSSSARNNTTSQTSPTRNPPPSSSQSRQPPPSSSTHPNTTTSQRSDYVASQKAAEAERIRIKAQMEADKRTRRETERKAREDAEIQRRRTELHDLRKANSTTTNPKATDVRIQVRLFDGGTIRNSFPAESTIARDLRPWIDGEVAKKITAGGSEGGAGQAGQPYNLKLILAPLPTRSIEAGEEDRALVDLEGVKGSATLVMVPVRTFVDSYGASSGGGIVGSAVGAAQSVVGAGVGLVGSAAGMVFGGLGRLMGGGGGGGVPQEQAQSSSGQVVGSPGPGHQTSGGSGGARVRSLADQRRDEEVDARRKGQQLYNGMGLNVQPRRDEGKDD